MTEDPVTDPERRRWTTEDEIAALLQEERLAVAGEPLPPSPRPSIEPAEETP